MTDKLFYCIPTYKSFDLAYNGILAALRGSVVPDQIIVIDNSSNANGTLYLQPLTQQYSNVYIWPQSRNLGVAASWNMFHDVLQADNIIIANDDVEVQTDTLKHLVAMSKEHPNEVLFAGSGMSGNAFSLFLLKQAGYKKIGRFDTNFYPAYYEDNDYAHRASLLGYTLMTAPLATYDHVGSSTMARYTEDEMQQHHHNFRRNTEYFINKWGGLPGEITYKEPFNGIM